MGMLIAEVVKHNVCLAGTLDADCPIWDHVVQLFVCCEDVDGRTDNCDKCDATPWMAMSQNGTSCSLRRPLAL